MAGPLISRLIVVLIAFYWVLLAGAEQAKAEETTARQLLFLTWSDYIDPQVVEEFEQKFKVEIKQIYFESDDDRDQLLVESDGTGYDLVVVNSPQFLSYWKRHWFAPIREADVPNLKYIDRRWINALPEAIGYGVPYFWGTTGIAYRADLVPEKITSWRQLFQPSEVLRGKIVMANSARDVIGMALKALGYSANSTSLKELEEAERLLLAQKRYVKSYSYVSLTKDSELVSGQVLAAMMYSGDALMVREHDSNIVYVVPEEGGELWIDYLTVLRSSPNKKLAMEFINFLNEPENAARLARFVHYATPNKAAEGLLPAEFLRDPDIYPSEAVLKRSECYVELPPRIAKQRNSIFTRLLQ